MEETQMALISHIDWRINENIHQVSISTSEPPTISYLEQGLFRFSKTDYKGRPVIYVNPKIFVPGSMQVTEDLKNTLILCLETLRRWIYFLGEGLSDQELLCQALLVVNLEGFGVSNMVSFSSIIVGLWINTNYL